MNQQQENELEHLEEQQHQHRVIDMIALQQQQQQQNEESITIEIILEQLDKISRDIDQMYHILNANKYLQVPGIKKLIEITDKDVNELYIKIIESSNK